MEWFIHILITSVFLFSKKSPWRWPHEWPKHVAYHNTIKYINEIKVYLLVLNILYESYAYFMFIFIINRKQRTSNICKRDNTHTHTHMCAKDSTTRAKTDIQTLSPHHKQLLMYQWRHVFETNTLHYHYWVLLYCEYLWDLSIGRKSVKVFL
jgi:hypothetical protein